MRAHHFFKKGFSPLVATILLIAFSVALISTIINWKQSLGTFDGGTCSKISFIIETLNDMHLCYKPLPDNIEINFLIKNNGGVDIEGMSMLIMGRDGKTLQDLDDLIVKKNSLSDVKNLKVEYDLNKYGPINKVYFTPEVEDNGVVDICPALLAEAEKIGECS
ncbi:hypothetical protein CMO93_03420 [Candidatus Woesearchaeota archaeon]|nr:hypothetical protein [Candidatus Woesearchaeota archaeon]|tara:strand:- start:1029 stop:1517 length:489 start_codon:yes stop_codon:yes gene_type:complete